MQPRTWTRLSSSTRQSQPTRCFDLRESVELNHSQRLRSAAASVPINGFRHAASSWSAESSRSSTVTGGLPAETTSRRCQSALRASGQGGSGRHRSGVVCRSRVSCPHRRVGVPQRRNTRRTMSSTSAGSRTRQRQSSCSRSWPTQCRCSAPFRHYAARFGAAGGFFA